MKFLITALLAFCSAACAQSAIPAGTVLPVRLNSSLDSIKNKPGQVITARIMQDVPLPKGQIPAGARVVGHIARVGPAMTVLRPSAVLFGCLRCLRFFRPGNNSCRTHKPGWRSNHRFQTRESSHPGGQWHAAPRAPVIREQVA
jgi:hypothetical protein